MQNDPEIYKKLAEWRKRNPQEQQGGPRTIGGKIRVAVNRKIRYGRGLEGNRMKLRQKNVFTTLMDEAKQRYGDSVKNLDNYNLFIAWIKTKTGEDLNEIMKLENLITLLETDMTNRAMGKLEKQEPLTDEDVRQIRLLKDALVELHKLKYGEKQINVNADFKDIRKMMFEK